MKVQSVLGEVKAEDLGVTLTHEHLSLNFSDFYREPPKELKEFFGPEITLQAAGYVKQFPYASKTNVHFYGEEVERAVWKEMELFKKFGGGTTVENTTHGIDRDLDVAYRVAKETGVNVIAGTGYYVDVTQSAARLSMDVESMCDEMRKDLTIGNPIKSSSELIKCGFIGEVASSWPMTDFEKRAIEAAALIQQESGCAVSFHPGRNSKAPFEVIRRYAEAGGAISKADMSHLDRAIQQTEELLEFARLGTYCQLDLLGTETSYYMLHPETSFPSDAQRIDRIMALIEEGFADKILVSHDIHTKHRLVEFGGHGYSHLLTNVPLQMAVKGMSQESMDKIYVQNPASWLCH